MKKRRKRVRSYSTSCSQECLKWPSRIHVSGGKKAKDGAEVSVRLVVDEKGTCPILGVTYWEFPWMGR